MKFKLTPIKKYSAEYTFYSYSFGEDGESIYQIPVTYTGTTKTTYGWLTTGYSGIVYNNDSTSWNTSNLTSIDFNSTL